MSDNFPIDQSDAGKIPDLADMLAMQRELQKEYTGQDPITLSPEAKMEYIRSQSLALTDEIHEVLAETGWKPWASSNHINLEAYKGEMVDAWHFFMNLMLVVGMTDLDLREGYDEKQRINWKRIRDGYTGLKKCPTCKRSYDDPATKCTEPEGPGMNSRCQDDPVPVPYDNRNHYVSDMNGYETSLCTTTNSEIPCRRMMLSSFNSLRAQNPGSTTTTSRVRKSLFMMWWWSVTPSTGT